MSQAIQADHQRYLKGMTRASFLRGFTSVLQNTLSLWRRRSNSQEF